MPQIFLNNARGILAESVSTGETILKIRDHANLPAPGSMGTGDYFLMTLFKDTTRYGENLEVVKVESVTSGTGDQLNLTVERGYEYPPQIHSAGARIEARLTAKSLEDMSDEAKAYADQAITDHTGTADDQLPTTQQIRDTFDLHVPDPLRRSVEAATGGLCTVERTPNGQPSFMYVIPKIWWEDLLPGQELGTGVHEAFLESGAEKSELLIGMYMAAELNSEMVSQPRTTGRRSIDWDESVAAAENVGMNLIGNWEWSAIAMWCMANGFQPRGNTDYGRSHSHPHERGVYDSVSGGDEYTLLGSGPNTWNHNNAANGIADLVGNRWEWVWGFKMVDGRIFLAPDNDRGVAESNWVDTGWDMPGGGTWASQDSTGAPQSVKRALIMPNGVADPDGKLWTNLSGERVPRRGGSRNAAGGAGLAALSLSDGRTYSGSDVGLRLSRLV